MKKLLITMLTALTIMHQSSAQKAPANKSLVTRTANGSVEGNLEKSGVRSFKGIPFAAPPVGDLRWKAPQPVANWTTTLQAKSFGNNPMQYAVFGDMAFRSKGNSEDCLYLNVWAPANASKSLPVLVYFYGGGFVAGDGSEARYDGESMATKGIVAVTVNYRLGAFGFMAHPELTKESPNKASGNYGLLDQAAALRWVHDNIAAFGGNPSKVTIAGESAGSASVSAQMVSPLSKGLIAGAIGESGSVLGTLSAQPLAKVEETGVEFAKAVGATSLAELRAMPADQLLEESKKFGVFRFAIAVDGYFFPEDPFAMYERGDQAHVPLLVGWNSEEMNYRALLGNEKPTKSNYAAAVKRLYNENADAILKVYKADSDDAVEQVATDLAGDRFIGFSTWKWSDVHTKTNQPIYRYYYSRPRPAMNASMGNATPGLAGGVVKDANAKPTPAAPAATGAVHSAEIEYAMGNLSSNTVFAWTPDDYKVSKVMQEYFANFIKTGNPNGKNLPQWPRVNSGNAVQFMTIDVDTRATTELHRDRYLLLDKLR